MKAAPRERSQRQLRVGEQIRHIVVETLRRGNFINPELMDASGITVTEVRVSPDLKNATAYTSILGIVDPQEEKAIIDALNRASGHFKRDMGKQLRLRYTPNIRFVNDKSFENADKIEHLLRSSAVQRDVVQNTPNDDDTEQE